MEKLFQAIYGGLLSGSVYGLMALGLTLIWGSLRMLNLAHGSLYLVGGYVIWTALNPLKLPVLPAFVLGVLGAALMGFLIQVLLINRILGKPGWDNASLLRLALVSSKAPCLSFTDRGLNKCPLLSKDNSNFWTWSLVIRVF
ncbi:MAG: hypothetical protein U0401_07470 [Anaerolineae bacterium]